VSGLAGLDTVGVSFPITGADEHGATVHVTDAGTEREKRTFRRMLPGGGFLAWGVGESAWVEASLPKRLGPTNVDALPAEVAREVLRDLIGEACNYVAADFAPLGDRRTAIVTEGLQGPKFHVRTWEQASVKRLDVARDFDGVTAIPALLDGLQSVRRPGRIKSQRFADAVANRAETLRVGPRSWSCTLYDKHAETKGLAAPGRLRFEARCRSELLAGARMVASVGRSVSRVGDITQERVDAICREQWAHVGFDREVNGAGAFAERINRADLPPRVKRDLVGYLAARALGVDLSMSDNTERKYRRLSADLGLVLLDADDLGFSARLDLDQGTQVVETQAHDGDPHGTAGGGTVESF
jgi:hypothetical protein